MQTECSKSDRTRARGLVYMNPQVTEYGCDEGGCECGISSLGAW